MSKNKLALEDANDILLENLARRVKDYSGSIHSIEKVKVEVNKSCLYSAYIVSLGAKWYMSLVNDIVEMIDTSSCLVGINGNDVNLVKNAIINAGFTSNQAGVYIEKKYGIDTDYSILGFVSDSNNYKQKGAR